MRMARECSTADIFIHVHETPVCLQLEYTVDVYVCGYVCVCICMYIRVYVRMYVHAYMHGLQDRG